MKRIGTHNSATGERVGNILSFFLIPFARCQSKTIAEQYDYGCRYFDLRVRYGNNGYYLCHGIYKTNRTLYGILGQLNSYKETIFVSVTLEGSCAFDDEFANSIHDIVYLYPYIELASINIKKPQYRNIYWSPNVPKAVSMYTILDGSTWHTYLPIPWLWDRIYTRPHCFNEDFFSVVDFL